MRVNRVCNNPVLLVLSPFPLKFQNNLLQGVKGKRRGESLKSARQKRIFFWPEIYFSDKL